MLNPGPKPPIVSCGTVTDVDGNTYNTVQIGQQCWMRENLRTKHYADGTSIPAGGNEMSDTVPYFYDYNTSKIPLEKRGYLYNWPAAMHGAVSSSAVPSGVQGICPTGWHLPSFAEWDTLTTYVRSQSEFGCKFSNNRYFAKSLASTSEWHKSTWGYGGDGFPCDVGNNQSSNNATGFCAFPTGYYYYSHYGNHDTCYYRSSGNIACFWSTRNSETSNVHASCFILENSYSDVQREGKRKREGCSVRCLRD